MKILTTLLLFMLLAFNANMAKSATVINFDEFTDTYTSLQNLPGYYGFDWNNLVVLNPAKAEYDPNSGFYKGVVSSPNVVYNDNSLPAYVSSNSSFDFDEAYFTAAKYGYPSLLLTITGFVGNTESSKNYTIYTDSPTLIEANLKNIDKVSFEVHTDSGQAGQFAMDNFTYSIPSASTPEPSSMIFGLVGLLLLGFRKKQLITLF